MAPTPAILLLAAATAIACHSAASAALITAKVFGISEDYVHADLHVFKCEVVPTDGSPPFFAECTPTQAQTLSRYDTVTIETAEHAAGDLNETTAALEVRLGIVRPLTRIVRATRAGKRARKQAPGGPRSMLLMVINYADMNVTYATEADARLMMQNPTGLDVAELYRSSSYGRMIWPADRTTVITINSPLNGVDQLGCPVFSMSEATDLLVAEQHPGINIADFLHKSYLIPAQVPGCGWEGVAYVDSCHNGGAHCKAWIRGSAATVLAHELGHNLGTQQAADDNDDDGLQGSEYGDSGCTMGRVDNWTSLNAPHRELLGYLGDGLGAETYDMACAAQSSSQVIRTISRLDLAPGAGNPNPNLLRIARFPSSNYLLSFKASADWDGPTINGDYGNRLQIHTHDGSLANTLFVRALGLRDVFIGTANRGGSSVLLRIAVTGIGVDAIAVTIDTGCGTHAHTFPPTAAPITPQMFQGAIVCGQTVDGTTTSPGTSLVGNLAPDHYWHFTLSRVTILTFNGCGSFYDTYIRVFDRLDTGAGGALLAPANQLAGNDDDSSCPHGSRSRLRTTLGAGDYSVVMEGFSNDHGIYSMTMECPLADVAQDTTDLTPGPTAIMVTTPELTPTPALTTSSPTPSPTSSPATAAIPEPTLSSAPCDPTSWDEVGNGNICTALSACSALIDFRNIAPTNCDEFCASHGLECDDAKDETGNSCQVRGGASGKLTCSTTIGGSTGWDAICYCSDASMPPPWSIVTATQNTTTPPPSPPTTLLPSSAPATSSPVPAPTPAPGSVSVSTTSSNPPHDDGLPLMLVDTSTIPASDLYLLDGSPIYMESIGTRKISIRYEHDLVTNEAPGSVRFDVRGSDGSSFSHVETSAPYSMLGDRKRGRKYIGWSPAAGMFTLTVKVFAGNGAPLQTFVTMLIIEESAAAALQGSALNSTGTTIERSRSAGTTWENAAMGGAVFFAALVIVVLVVSKLRRNRRHTADLFGERRRNSTLSWDEYSHNDVFKVQPADRVGLANDTEPFLSDAVSPRAQKRRRNRRSSSVFPMPDPMAAGLQPQPSPYPQNNATVKVISGTTVPRTEIFISIPQQ